MVFRVLSLAFVLSAAGARALVIERNATIEFDKRYSSSAVQGGWSYAGCFVDDVGNRLLPAQYQSVDNQSPQQCIGWCGSMGYAYAGLEYGRECMCAGTYAYSPQQTSDDDCNMQCSGDGSQTCGAGNRLQVYQTAATSAPAEHYITIVNGCKTRTVQPTLYLSAGTFGGNSAPTLSPGDTAVFKLISATAWTGTMYEAMSSQQSSGSRMQFHFDGALQGQSSYGWYFINNYGGFTIPQVAVSWPSTQSCVTKRCYTNSCDNTQALGSDVSAAAKALVTASCTETNQGITLYYCSAQ